MEYKNIYQVKNIIGDYANISFDNDLNVTYKNCDICGIVCQKYYHTRSDPLYIANDYHQTLSPLIVKIYPYNYNWIYVKEYIREKFFPNDMIWVRHQDVIKLRESKFSSMKRIFFYEYICNEEFYKNDFSKDYKIITHCKNCRKTALIEVGDI